MSSNKHQIESASRRPDIGTIDLDSIPESLRSLDQWVSWRYSRRPGESRWTKVPQKFLPSKKGGPLSFAFAKSSDPKTWGPFDHAATAFIRSASHDRPKKWRGMYGLGFVLAEGGNITVIDLDDCRNPETGDITPEAMVIVRRLNSYTEVSPSRTGLKIFLLGTKTCNKSRPTGRDIEVYDRLRFLAVTGDHLSGTPAELEDRQDALDAFLRELFPAEYDADGKPKPKRAGDSHTPLAPRNVDLSDVELINRIRESKQSAKFNRLMAGDTSDYDDNRSRADGGLARIFAWWTGGDVERIARLMWTSNLARKKWERHDYLFDYTIRGAVAKCSSFHGDQQPDVIDADILEAAAADEAAQARLDATVAAYDPAADHKAHVACYAAYVTACLLAGWRKDQAETRDAIRAMRRDHDRYHCCNPRNVVCIHKETHEPRVTTVRCEKAAGCCGCRQYLIQRELASLRCHWTHAGQLFEFGCDRSQWKAMQKRIRRAGGQYACVEDGAGFWVVASVWVAGAIPVRPEVAMGNLELLLEEWDGSRPLTTSHGWKLPSLRDDDKVYERVGSGLPGLTAEKVDEVAEKHNAEVVRSAAQPDTPSRVLRTSTLRRRDWTRDTGLAAARELTYQEVDVSGFDWRGSMLARREKLLDELAMAGG